MNKKKTIREICIFICLMSVVFVIYYVSKNNLKSVYTSQNEYTRTIDCAPIIDRYGLERSYVVEFDLKTNKPGEVLVYFENGSNTKHAFYEYINADTEYQHYRLIVQPVMCDEHVESSHLAFYGSYGTGIVSTVKKIKFYVLE